MEKDRGKVEYTNRGILDEIRTLYLMLSVIRFKQRKKEKQTQQT